MRGEYEALIRLQRVGHHGHHLARVLLVILGDIGEQLVLVVTMNDGELWSGGNECVTWVMNSLSRIKLHKCSWRMSPAAEAKEMSILATES